MFLHIVIWGLFSKNSYYRISTCIIEFIHNFTTVKESPLTLTILN